MNILKKILFLFIVVIIMVPPVYATDSAKELRWANQVVEFLVEGEPHWLKAGGRNFLGIYSPATTVEPAGAVIILHGRGVHPNWPQVIQPLRTELPNLGWATLSLQMPVLSNGANVQEYVPLFSGVPTRILAGLDFLTKQHHKQVILIGHGLGTNMATDFLANNHEPRIKAFVGIGMMGNRQTNEYLELDNVAALLRLKVPVLDVYGSRSTEQVLSSVDRRAYAVYQARDDNSLQIEVKGANQFFQGYETQLVNTIASWMSELSNLKEANKLVSSDNQPNSK